MANESMALPIDENFSPCSSELSESLKNHIPPVIAARAPFTAVDGAAAVVVADPCRIENAPPVAPPYTIDCMVAARDQVS